MQVHCRFCDAKLDAPFLDLGMSPLSNAFLREESLNGPEVFFPLKVYVCSLCRLVQLSESEAPEKIFNDYAYFSSYSSSWLEHARNYVEMAIHRFSLGPDSRVVEIASNDGYLLQYFKEKGIPAVGFEPAENVAKIAMEKGIDTWVQFFGTVAAAQLVKKKGKADLILGNNVLAHVPDLNDFVAGLKIALSERGHITLEVPHLLKLLEQNQFDTIYHEHFSYFSLYSLLKIFEKHDLQIRDVEELSTHGGSLRLFVVHTENEMVAISDTVSEILSAELEFGVEGEKVYSSFNVHVLNIKKQIWDFLYELKCAGKTIAGYGAPAKANTFLNYCGIPGDLLPFTVDQNPHKQGCYLPGTHIPIYHPESLEKIKPDYVFLLPWNLKKELSEQLRFIRDWGGQFVTSIPALEVF